MTEAKPRDLPELAVLRLQRGMRLSSPGFGLLGALVALVIMLSPLLTIDLHRSVRNDVVAAALFFATSFGILLGFATPVFRGATADLLELRGVLQIPQKDFLALAKGISRAPVATQLLWMLLGSAAGLAHSWFLGHLQSPMPFSLTQTLGTTGLWIAMFSVISKLISNAFVFSRLGASANPDLLRPSRQAPFGAAAVRPGLFLTGLLCAYALLWIGGGNPLEDGVWVGALVALLSWIGIITLPLRGIRRRIRECRAESLGVLDSRIEESAASGLAAASVDELETLDTLLDMRERIAGAPAWPFDLTGLRRIMLYIVLPPLTWAAAALVERLIEGLI